MKLIVSLIFLISFQGIAQFSDEQQSHIDSLWKSTQNRDLSDSTRWTSYGSLLDEMRQINPDSAFVLAKMFLAETEEVQDPKGMAIALSHMGMCHSEVGLYSQSIHYYNRSLALAKKANNKKRLASLYLNIGASSRRIGDVEKSIKDTRLALAMAEEVKDTLLISKALNNLGNIYIVIKEFDKALVEYSKAIVLTLKSNNKGEAARAYSSLGLGHFYAGNLDSSKYNYQIALKIAIEINDVQRRSIAYTGIAGVHYRKSEFDTCLYYYKKCIQIGLVSGRRESLGTAYLNVAYTYDMQSKLNLAAIYADSALSIAKETGAVRKLMNVSSLLYQIQKKQGQYLKALETLELNILYKDSVVNDKNKKSAFKSEMQYNFDKEALSDSLNSAFLLGEQKNIADKKDALLKQEKAEGQRKQTQLYAVYGGLALVLVLALVLFRSVRQKKLDNMVIRSQKKKVDEAFDELEEKNTEILDSINYAKRIQSAILPPSKLVKEYLNQSFILYKPKDIVAGDFYWMEPQKDGVLFAAADCTGHGVPGAMVSVVCNNGLNRSVREYGLTDPGQILDKTREIVISEFEKSEEEVKDGMDIALCSLQGKTLKYAGAHNPLWIIRKGATEIEEIKADKQPIGKYAEPKPYTTHSIELQEGDSFYIFSDGYADQFGGERGKKYKSANFKRLLLSIQNETIEQQRTLIDEAFEVWKGQIEQLDDVCVIGVRV